MRPLYSGWLLLLLLICHLYLIHCAEEETKPYTPEDDEVIDADEAIGIEAKDKPVEQEQESADRGQASRHESIEEIRERIRRDREANRDVDIEEARRRAEEIRAKMGKERGAHPRGFEFDEERERRRRERREERRAEREKRREERMRERGISPEEIDRMRQERRRDRRRFDPDDFDPKNFDPRRDRPPRPDMFDGERPKFEPPFDRERMKDFDPRNRRRPQRRRRADMPDEL